MEQSKKKTALDRLKPGQGGGQDITDTTQDSRMGCIKRRPERIVVTPLFGGDFIDLNGEHTIGQIRPFREVGYPVEKDRALRLEHRLVVVGIQLATADAAARRDST